MIATNGTKKGQVIGLDYTWDEIERAKKENKLLTLDLELSRRCNLRCIYCYAESGLAKNDELTLDEIKDTIDQGIELGLQKVSIVGGGEPLSYPYFFEVAEYIQEKGLEQIVFTNGTLITKEIAEKLKKLQISVVFKLNSFDEEVQDYLAGGKNVLRRIMTGYENLCEAGYLEDEDITLGIESIICQQNLSELPTIWRWARDRNIIPYFEVLTMQGRANENPLEVPLDQLKILFERLLEIDHEYGYDWIPKPPIVGLTCQRNLYAVLLTSTGKVQPCAGIEIKVGDIRKQSLKEIIVGSEVLQNLRRMPKSLEGECGDCKNNSSCYGCRGSAYNLTGNYLASDPLCWHYDREMGKVMTCGLKEAK